MNAATNRSLAVNDCRLCRGKLGEPVLVLGDQPISNRLSVSLTQDATVERFPLTIVLCTACGLPQLAHNLDASAHFHDDYVYISGASSTWVRHCAQYAQDLVRNEGLAPGDFVVEIGSNDGTLLKAFADAGLRTLGIEPSANVATLAQQQGVETLARFFDAETANIVRAEYGRPKALVGNNVLAHVPDTGAFLEAARDLIDPEGFLCFEFPHYTRILDHRYFDTIYHEHYTYLGVGPLKQWASTHGMVVYQVHRQPTHGGSLRVFLKLADAQSTAPAASVAEVMAEEVALGGTRPWQELTHWLQQWRKQVRLLLDQYKEQGRKVAGYAAASKATVICNFVGMDASDIAYCCDASPLKQNRIIPGTGIPIVNPEHMKEEPPDVVVVFAWNIFDEIAGRIAELVARPTVVVRPLPNLEVVTVNPGDGE